MRRSFGLALSTLVAAAAPAFAGHDFNGDGFDDLAVGTPLEDFNGNADAGSVTVLYGSANGLGNGPAAQLLTMAELDVAPLQDHMYFGSALAAGDFDGDGFDDLAMAAPYLTQGGIDGAGAVVVMRGGINGLVKAGMQLISQAVPGVPDKPESSMFYAEQFGQTLAAGDFDGDGRDDLVVYVSESVTKGTEQSGAIHVFKGSKKGLRLKGSKFLHLNTKGIPGLPTFMAGFGQRLATGDLDGDGRDELVLTTNVPFDIDTTMTTFVLRGTKKGLATNHVLAFPPDGDGQTFNDTSGSPLTPAVGDTNGDGFADLVCGTWFETIDDLIAAGAIHCFDGSAVGLDVATHSHIDRGGSSVLSDPEQLAYFGQAVAIGDFNGDGFADTAVGAPQATVSGVANAGDVSVFPGSATGVSTNGDTYWSQDTPGVPELAESPDLFGAALATGDFDGDGFDDLAIGSPRDSDGAIADSGALHVIYGKATTGLDVTTCVLLEQSSGFVPDIAEANDEFATALSR